MHIWLALEVKLDNQNYLSIFVFLGLYIGGTAGSNSTGGKFLSVPPTPATVQDGQGQNVNNNALQEESVEETPEIAVSLAVSLKQ